MTRVQHGIRQSLGQHHLDAASQHWPALDAGLRLAGRWPPCTLCRTARRFSPVSATTSFFVDLGSVFDLLGLRPFNPAHTSIPLPAAAGVDGLKGFNVHTIALQVPKRLLTHDGSLGSDPGNPNSIIGVYSTTWRRRVRVLRSVRSGDDDRNDDSADADAHDWIQVSRLGMPLVNEVVIPLADKNRFNASDPRDDAQFLPYVLQPGACASDPRALPRSRSSALSAQRSGRDLPHRYRRSQPAGARHAVRR